MSGPNEPDVSVIMPCYDSSATVAAALDSALTQTFDELEIIAIDDGSTDHTLEILEEAAERDPGRVKVLRSSHRGPYVARNLGAASAAGAFLAFLDSDDLWEPTKLERQVTLMRARPEVVLCHTGGATMNARGEVQRVFPAHPDYNGRCLSHLLVRNRIATSSVMVRRAFFEELGGFDEAFGARGDWEMWTRMARHGELAAIDDPLIRYRFHEGRMSNDIERMRREHLRVIEKHGRSYRGVVPGLGRCLRESRFHAHLAYGSDYLGAGRAADAAGEALRAIRERPMEPRGWKLLARSVLGKEWVSRIRGARVAVEGKPSSAPASRPRERR